MAMMMIIMMRQQIDIYIYIPFIYILHGFRARDYTLVFDGMIATAAAALV